MAAARWFDTPTILRRVATSVVALGVCAIAAADARCESLDRTFDRALDLALDDPRSLYALWREDQRVVDRSLLTMLTDDDPGVRTRAVLAVGRIGRPEDVDRVASLLGDAQASVRRAAAFALGEIADSTAAVRVVSRLDRGEPDAAVRGALVEALGKLRRGGDACRRALSDDAKSVRSRALIAAWQIPVPDVVDAVIERTRSSDLGERWAATYCLMRLMGAPASGRTPIATAPKLADDERAAATKRLVELLGDVDADIRAVAARGLQSADAGSVTRALTAALNDDDWRVRVEVLRALGEGDHAAAADVAVVVHRLDDAHPLVGHTAMTSLGRVGRDADAMPHLLGALRSPNPMRIQLAFRSLVTRWRADSARATAAPRIAQVERVAAVLLGHDRAAVRSEVLDALDLLDAEPAARDAVLDAALASEDTVVKLAASAAIDRAWSGDDRWAALVAEVGRLTESVDPMVHLMTWSAVVETVYGDSTSSETERAHVDGWLEAAVEQWAGPAGSDVRHAIVDAVANLDDRDRIAALLERARTDDAYVIRRAAARALGRSETDAPVVPANALPAFHDYTHVARWASDPMWAVWQIDGGRIVARLHTADAPLTTWNFARLANAGFYDDGVWHRVVPDFVVQNGCPRGDGWGGPDWLVRCEITEHGYGTGALGMAHAGKDTGGSQYFFTHSAQPHLDGGYTLFGQLDAASQAIVDRIDQGSDIHWVRVVDAPPETWSP